MDYKGILKSISIKHVFSKNVQYQRSDKKRGNRKKLYNKAKLSKTKQSSAL